MPEAKLTNATRADARFTPSTHGLRFQNTFPGAPLPFTVPGPARTSYGLCGGMCFAALDYLHAGQPIPDFTHVPEKNSRFWRYLYRRQFDSFGSGWGYVLKFALWTLLPDAAVRRRTARSLAHVRRQLDRGAPVVLGVIYVGWLGSPRSLAVWQNHQVVAYRYEASRPDVTDLYIYDPNHPRDDTDFIRCEASGEGVACTQKSARREDRPVRGFFLMRYRPKSPPEVHGHPP